LTDRVTIQEAARIANISRPTIYRWIEKGLLSREKDGKRAYVSLAEVQALCKQGDTDDTHDDTQSVKAGSDDTNRVTVDVTYLEGLLVRLGQLEAEKRYLLEYKAGVEQKDKEIDRLKDEVNRLRLPWWKRLFRKDKS